MKHVVKEGARNHVLSWSLTRDGRAMRHCSEPRCEINVPSDSSSTRRST